MGELKWEAYLINGAGGEVIDIKTLTEEQRRRLSGRLNEQCAGAVKIRPGAAGQTETVRDT